MEALPFEVLLIEGQGVASHLWSGRGTGLVASDLCQQRTELDVRLGGLMPSISGTEMVTSFLGNSYQFRTQR